MKSPAQIGFVCLCLFFGSSDLNAQLIVAHRGASADAPENTVAAFQLAWEKQADAVEGDFYLTTDGQIVCIHDDTTERVSGTKLPVANSTLAQLKQVNVGSWKEPRFADEHIPTLSEVLAIVPRTKTIFIEIKCGPEIVPALTAVLAKSGISSEQTAIICFQANVIQAVKQALPHWPAYWLVNFKQDERTGEWSPSRDEVLRTAARVDADGVDLSANTTVIDRDFVQQCRDAGLSVHVWTVDEPEVARHFQELQVDSITTNRPLALRKALSREAAPSREPASGRPAAQVPAGVP